MAWVRLPRILMVYYDENSLKAIVIYLGQPVTIKSSTTLATQGKFAWVCIEVNLTKPLVGQIVINGRQKRMEYESLRVVCFHCGCYKHTFESCQIKIQKLKETKQATSAMVVSVKNGGDLDKWEMIMYGEKLQILIETNISVNRSKCEGVKEGSNFDAWMVVVKSWCNTRGQNNKNVTRDIKVDGANKFSILVGLNRTEEGELDDCIEILSPTYYLRPR